VLGAAVLLLFSGFALGFLVPLHCLALFLRLPICQFPLLLDRLASLAAIAGVIPFSLCGHRPCNTQEEQKQAGCDSFHRSIFRGTVAILTLGRDKARIVENAKMYRRPP
jgi:hypothetical protein